MTILELFEFFVAIKRVCSRLFTAYRGNIVGRHRLFDSPRRPEAADRGANRSPIAPSTTARNALHPSETSH
jgi:hypothetical protein